MAFSSSFASFSLNSSVLACSANVSKLPEHSAFMFLLRTVELIRLLPNTELQTWRSWCDLSRAELWRWAGRIQPPSHASLPCCGGSWAPTRGDHHCLLFTSINRKCINLFFVVIMIKLNLFDAPELILLWMFSLVSASLSQLCVDTLKSCRTDNKDRTMSQIHVLQRALCSSAWLWFIHLDWGPPGCGRTAELRAGTWPQARRRTRERTGRRNPRGQSLCRGDGSVSFLFF